MILIEYFFEKHEENPIKSVKHNGQSGHSETTDTSLHHKDGAITKISLKENGSYILRTTTVNKIIEGLQSADINEIYEAYLKDLINKVYGKISEKFKEGGEYNNNIKSYIDYRSKNPATRSAKEIKINIKTLISEYNKKSPKAYQELYNIRLKLQLELMKKIIEKEQDMKIIIRFLKKNIISVNKGIELININNKKGTKKISIILNYDAQEKVKKNIALIDENIENIIRYEYQDGTAVSQFAIILHFNNMTDKIKIMCSTSSGQSDNASKMVGNKLKDYNMKFEILKLGLIK